MQSRLESLAAHDLAAARGGMNTADFRRSPNIEDRRPPQAVREDSAWLQSLGQRKPDAANPWSPWPPMQPLPQRSF